MEHVQPRKSEERGAKQGRTPWITPRTDAFLDQVEPLAGVQNDERRSAQHREQNVSHYARLVSTLRRGDCQRHGQAGRQQAKRHQTGKCTDGHIGNGVGQLWLAARAYMAEMSKDPNVSESEIRNSHMPSFLCPTAYGDTPPLHSADASIVLI